MKKISNDDIAISYSIATDRIARISSDLYEELFDEAGLTATCNAEDIEKMIIDHRKLINIEFDMIRSAASQYRDDNKL